MLEAKRLSKSSRRSAWSYATILGAAALSACVFLDPKGGNDGKNAAAVPLFNEQVPLPEAKTWPVQSGVEFSALGSINPVFFDAAASPLRSAGSRIKFNLFEGVNLYAVVDKSTGKGNHFVAKGHIEGIADGSFLISSYNGLLSGVVRAAEAGNFNVTFTREGGYRVSKLNDYDFNFTEAEPVGAASPTTVGALAARAAALQKKSGTVRVDVAFLYDSAVTSALGSDDSVRALVAAAVDEANDVFSSTGVDLELNIVDTTEVSVIVSDTADSALARIKRDSTSTYKIAHTIRKATSADIVVWIANDLGSVSGATTTLLKTGVSTGAANAFIVMTPDALQLGEYGVTILVGKNMGCATDVKSGKKDKGYDTYSRGFTFKGKDKASYRTVEAGGTGTLIPYFSNPSLKYSEKPIGSKTADNAKTLRATGPIVAAYKGDDADAEASITFPADGASYGGTNLKIVASVSDDAGNDTVVFVDSVGGAEEELCEVTASPYTCFATALDSGDHKVFVRVTDGSGNVTVSDAVTVTMGAENAPDSLTEEYLGKSGYNGSVSSSNGVYTITTTSAGLGLTDDVQFLYHDISAGGRISATFAVDTSSDDTLARFGVMVRDSLHRDGPMAFLSLGNDGKVNISTRVKAGKASVTKTLKTGITEASFMMVRNSNFAYIYWDSTATSSWKYLTKVNFGAKAGAYIGVAAASGDSTNATSIDVSDIDYVTSSNAPPTLSGVTGITEGQSITGSDSLTIAVKTITDPNNAKEIKCIKIYGYRSDSTFLLGQDSTKPWSKKVGTKVGLTHIGIFAYDASDSTGVFYSVSASNDYPTLILGTTDTVTVHLVEDDSTVVDSLARDDGSLTFTQKASADSAKFTVTSGGALNFKFKPQQDSAVDSDANNTYFAKYSVTDGSFTLTQTVRVVIHSAPIITSLDSGTTAVDTVNENTLAVHTITSADADGDTRVYSISGGADQSLFSINSSSGALVFKSAPDYEEPADANTDNNYVVKVRVSDSATYDEQTITVTVKNVSDALLDTVLASKDAWGQGKDSAAVNHGSSNALYVRKAGTDTTNYFTSVMTFSLTSLDTITAATLRLFGAASNYDDTVHVVVKKFLDTTYTEGSITYSGMADSLMSTTIDTLDVIRTSNLTYDVNVTTVTAAVKNAGGTRVSFALLGQDSTTNRAVFYSKNGSTTYGPRLLLTGKK